METLATVGAPFLVSTVPGDEFATAAAAFVHDGANGRYDPEWVRQANEASAQRQAGAFDEYEEYRFQMNWADDLNDPECQSGESQNDGDDDDEDPDDQHRGYSQDIQNQQIAQNQTRAGTDVIQSSPYQYEDITQYSMDASTSVVQPFTIQHQYNSPNQMDVITDVFVQPCPYPVDVITSDMKLQQMMKSKPRHLDHSRMAVRTGDILRLLSDTNEILKEAIVRSPYCTPIPEAVLICCNVGYISRKHQSRHRHWSRPWNRYPCTTVHSEYPSIRPWSYQNL